MLGQRFPSHFQQQPLVFLLALSGHESLLRICEFRLSFLSWHVSLLLPDHCIIQLFGLGSQFILGSNVGSLRSLQFLG
jgi:hypothetical protein